jgi:hypothetical protein
VHGDAADHQHLVLELDLTDRLNLVALRVDFDVTRLQLAGAGAGQSPAGRGDHIVERGCVRRVLLRRDAVVRGDLRVPPKATGAGSAGRWASRCGPPRRSMRTRET